MVCGWHCSKGPVSGIAPLHTWTLRPEHWLFSSVLLHSAVVEQFQQSVREECLPAYSLNNNSQSQRLLSKGGRFGIGQDAVKIGGTGEGGLIQTIKSPCIAKCIFGRPLLYYSKICFCRISPSYIISFIACMYQPPVHTYYAPRFSSTQYDYSMSTPVTKQLAWTGQLYSSQNFSSSKCFILSIRIVLNVGLLSTSVSIPARGPRGPTAPRH